MPIVGHFEVIFDAGKLKAEGNVGNNYRWLSLSHVSESLVTNVSVYFDDDSEINNVIAALEVLKR